jgi:hypothetical protein
MLLPVALLLVPPTDATPIPTTAHSLSVQTPSVLIDDEANVFRFPQLAVTRPATLSSFGSTGEESWGSGVQGNLESHSLSYIFQRAVPSEVAVDTEYPLFQTAWAGRLADFRAGVAYAWGTLGEKDKAESMLHAPSDDTLRRRSTFQTIDYRQLSAGVGWEGPAVSLDIVVDWQREDLVYDFVVLGSDTENGVVRTELREFHLRAKGGYRLGGAIRARLQLGSGAFLQTFGSYQETSHDFSATSRFERSVGPSIVVDEELFRIRDRDHGQRWSAGALGGGELGRARWTAHAFYVNRRQPWVYDSFSDDWHRARLKLDEGQLGVAFELPFPWRMTLRTGTALGFLVTRTRSERFSSRDEGAVREIARLSVEESLRDNFAWGLSRSFGSVDIAGSVRTTLNLSRLFLALDIHMRL